MLVGGPSSAKLFPLAQTSSYTPLPMVCMIGLTKPLEETFCFGICFDGIDTFDYRIQYFLQFRSNIFSN